MRQRLPSLRIVALNRRLHNFAPSLRPRARLFRALALFRKLVDPLRLSGLLCIYQATGSGVPDYPARMHGTRPETEFHWTVNVNVAVCFNVPAIPVDLTL